MMKFVSIKPWPHRASAPASALTLSSMLEYDADTCCGFINQFRPLQVSILRLTCTVVDRLVDMILIVLDL